MRRARGLLVGLVVLTLAGSMFAAAPFSLNKGEGLDFGFGIGDVRNLLRGSVGNDRSKDLATLRLSLGPGLARDEPAGTGKRWPAQKRVRELVDRRTANGKFFQLSDGRVQGEVATGPIHYRDEGGKWRPIDTRVRDTNRPGFVVGNSTNTFTSLFGDSTDRLVRFEWEGRSVELGLPGKARKVRPVVDGSTVTYRGLLGGADLVYEVTPTTLKENIVLRSKPASAVSYGFTVAMRGLAARQGKDGSVSFTGLDGGQPLLTLPAPFMFDDRNDKKSPHGKTWSDKVTQKLTRTGGKALVTVTPDAKWLSDSARKYPVTVDPTVKVQPVPADGQDVQIYSGSTATNYNSTYQLKVGTDSSQMYRTLVKYPLTGVPSNTLLDDARLELFYDQHHWTWEYDVAMEARRVTAPWSESTATWANMNANSAAQPAGNMVTIDDGAAGTSVVGTWPYSTNTTLTPLAINSDYRYNNDATAGHSHTWVPTITETGDYQVEVHYVSETDRPTNTPYTVYHASGSTNYSVNQYEPTTAEGKWTTLGVHRFNAGTSHKVVLGDVASKAVIADAVRFTRWGVATKKRFITSVWSSFPVRNVVQDWVNGTQPNYGFMIKAVDEVRKGRGGPAFEASEYAYQNGGRDYNLPRLILTWGRPGVTLSPLTTVTSTGALLGWTAYQDPSTSPNDDIIEYQVHRSVRQTFVPSAATLVSPVAPGKLSYQDTSATPTPADTPDDQIGQYYYYMIAVKTRDGQVIPAPTQGARLPKAGHVTKIFRTSLTDTTLSAARPTENVDVYDGDPYVSPGNNSTYYGDTRGLVKFGSITGVPTDAQITTAQLRMWTTYQYPGTDTNEWVDVHKLTRAFSETTATWNNASSTTAWTTPGGDYDRTALSGVTSITNDPEWQRWDVRSTVEGWIDNPTTNYGFLLRMRDEAVSTARVMLMSSEGPEPLVRPTLEVTYLEKTPASTYYVASTPARMIPGDLYTIPVTLSNTTLNTWNTTTWELSYRWTLPDGTDVTNSGNQLATPLPQDLSPGETVDINAQLRTPIQSDAGNKRTEYVLKWELRNKTTGQWLSETDNIASLNQNVTVEDPTSNQLGLEKFYAYAGNNTGAGGTVMNNLYAGNTVWSYNAFTNPSRGLTTFVRLAYNSLDTSDTVSGYGWSLQASTLMRLGTPLDFHPNPNPTKVTLTDGDGTSHTFSWDATTGKWVNPKGVHLYLERLVACGQQTEEDRAWVLTRPDRTQFFYDCDGYLSATVDNNGNELLFTYEERNSNNKPTKFLQYITDPVGRQTLTLTYYAKGENYDYIDDTTWTRQSATNLTNQKIIDHVKTITDISGRTLTFTYTDKGLLGEFIDGAGSSQPKVFKFRYDMTQGNKNVKLVRATDPRGNATNLAYYSNPEDDPKFKWWTKTYTDRLGHPTTFGYTDSDGQAGSNIQTVVTDAENHATTYLIDGFGRPTQITNAKNQTTKLGWDADNNVIRLEEANGAVSTWVYDQKTGYPTEIKDAEAVANGRPGTILTYQTQLDGHVAEVISKTSPEGRRSTFGYTLEGDLAWVVDPLGNTTPDADDYKTSYTYDTWGQLQTATDANGNATTNSNFDPNGYPRTITDALNNATTFVYDIRGNVTSVTDALANTTTQTYDAFGRPLENRVPKDQGTGVFITTPAPVYDANDNVVTETAPNGAATTASYDAADQLSYILAPVDSAGDPERKISYTYDGVGNVLTTTEPKGNLTPSDPNDFAITNTYDEIYQLVAVTSANGDRISSTYDSVGNITTVIDPRKNASSDPGDYTTRYVYDLNHRATVATDAAGHTRSTEYDRDGLAVATIDQEGNRSSLSYNARGDVVEEKMPYKNDGGTIVHNITRYEYDEIGNRTKVITPRGVATPSVVDDFTYQTVYDALNRVKEEWSAYDAGDSRYNMPDKTIYSYDQLGRLSVVSAPPSSGESVRNDTRYSYWDNGWTKTSTDPWDIVASYDYNVLGQQTQSTLSSAGGSVSRTMRWDFYPSGNLKARSDDGVPVGQQAVLADNSDFNNTTNTGTWTAGTTGTEFQGYNYQTSNAGTGSDTFTWNLVIPQDGNYDVYVRYPTVSGAASNASFTVDHAAGTATRAVDQTMGTGTWVSIGRYAFTASGTNQKITLNDSANGTVVADAVKLVRDNSADVDNERKNFTYRYDPNGNLVEVADLSPDAMVDSYLSTYDGLNRVATVQEKVGTNVRNTTSFQYDENSNVTTRTHDASWSQFEYDARDLLTKVTNAASQSAVDKRVTTYVYTPRSQMQRQVKPNANTVDYTYYLSGAVQHQVEKQAGGTVVAEHTLEYTPNGDSAKDVTRVMNADNSTAYVDNTYTYIYDPQDRVAIVDKAGANPAVERYFHDANSNVIQQTTDGVTTNHNYDRNRLMTSTAVGGLTSVYNYDPLGRLDTVSTGGQVTEKYRYDGFDRIAELRSGAGTAAKTTRYVYDPFDRTASETTDAGGTGQKTTTYTYLGTSGDVLYEEVAGKATKSYEYSAWGQKLTQIKHNDDDTREISHYTNHPKGDVEAITKPDGTTRATYGYTAYGENDDSKFTGVDKPDPQKPDAEPYNPYRFNGHRWDEASGTYDMGFRNYDPGLNQFLSRDLYNGALDDLTLAIDPFSGSRYAFGGGNPISNVEIDGHGFWNSVKSVGAGIVNHIKEDPLQFAAEVAVGIAATAAVGAACVATVGVGCVVAGAVIGGAIAGGFSYGYDVAQGEHDWDWGDFGESVGWGAAIGLATFGLGRFLRGGWNRLRPGSTKPSGTKPTGATPEEGAGTPHGGTPEPTAAPAAPKPAPARPAQAPSRAPSCNSFTPETQVVMADRSARQIENVKIGDFVLATDPKTGETGGRMVLALIVGQGAKDLVEVTVDTDGKAGDDTGTVIATDGHPFWVENLQAWVDAKDLSPGDMLRTSAGTWVQVTATREFQRHQRVHNLTVADIHTYYVLTGETPVLVHNTTPTPPTPQGVVYLRTDLATGAEYVGQAKSWSRYLERQLEHARDYPNRQFTFEVLGRANPGQHLDVLEESWMRAGGGKKTVPGSVLENGRVQMSDARYKAAGGTVC